MNIFSILLPCWVLLFCLMLCVGSVDGRNGGGDRRRPRPNRGHLLRGLPFVNAVGNLGNNVILPSIRVYRDYLHHAGRAHTYEVSDSISLWIGLITLLFSIAFMRNMRARRLDGVTLRQAVIMGSVAEHLNRTVRPDENSIGGGLELLHALLLEILNGLDETLPVIFGHYVPNNNHREAIRAYLEDYRANGIHGNVPFPINFIQNPWLLNDDNEEDNEDDENEGNADGNGNENDNGNDKGNDNEGDDNEGNVGELIVE